MTWVPVVDISVHQGAVDFGVMASHGVAGVIIRAGNGTTVDGLYAANCKAAGAAGLKIGAYWFCNPRAASGAVQGGLLAAAHNAQACDLPPMLDVENYTNEPGSLPDITGQPFALWLDAMCQAVEAQARTPIIYANASFWNPNVGDNTFSHYDCIVARYPYYSLAACQAHVPPLDATQWGDWIMAATTSRPQVPVGWSSWAGWQFSAGYNRRGKAYGCSSGDLDLNIIRPEVWARWLQPITPNIPTEDEPPVVQPQEKTDDVKYITLIADGRDQTVMAFDGSGHAVLPIPAQDDVAAIRQAYGADKDNWAPECKVSPTTYDALLLSANKPYVALEGELATIEAQAFPDLVKVQIVGVGPS